MTMTRNTTLALLAGVVVALYALARGGPAPSVGDDVAGPSEAMGSSPPSSQSPQTGGQAPSDPSERDPMTEPPELVEGEITIQRLQENPDLLAGVPERVRALIEEDFETGSGGHYNVGPGWDLSANASEAVGQLTVVAPSLPAHRDGWGGLAWPSGREHFREHGTLEGWSAPDQLAVVEFDARGIATIARSNIA